MTQEMTFRQWPVRIERKAYRRSLSIVLKRGEPILVKAGIATSTRKIEQFLSLKEKWIAKNMQQFSEVDKKYPEKKLNSDEQFLFLGKNLKLKFLPTPLKQVFFSRSEKALQMHLPETLWNQSSEEDLQKYQEDLNKYYLREAKKLISERIQIWSFQMQLQPRAVRFKNQQTRWGSCSSKKIINLNWRLIAAPVEVIDYILIHELAHLAHMNHSKSFWDLVEKHCPDYQDAEKWLKDHHHSLDFLSKR
jgi:predicted metal-dependent hydrolase